MFVVAPEDASTCNSKGPKGEWLKEPMTVSLLVTASAEKSHR